jgi:CheY-like chemotaxis protein
MGTAPCLVLLDMMMPEMSGSELLKILRDTHRLASLPVVVVSAHSNESEADGAWRFIRKPVSAEILLAVVHEFCRP